ncbi:tyrosine-type recombinase/integrase [Mycolicibacterium tusciae]|uniref:tyrosine-type recombinase/integrase n=1 Tax=Mycolicibacterium tusciae TaxID=75922 RepID=UPI001EF7A95A|nr:tyrosine-type recombinase/integrase [Mycolicibacterium tusciae]
MLTPSAVTSITNDLGLSPHDRQSASRTTRRESATSNATRTQPHTTTAETRRSYAQRHADAGVPIDVLAELLDHRSYSMTRRYYRIGEDRRRAAVDTVTALSFDRHGNRIWRDAQMLLDSERARHAVGDGCRPLRHLHRADQCQSRRRSLPGPVPVRGL